MAVGQKAVVATGVVTGHVTCSDTQKPARGAEVSLVGVAPVMTKDGNRTRMMQTETSLDGSFVVRKLAPGDYYAVATMPGYVLPLVFDEHRNPSTNLDLSKVMASFPVVHVVAGRATAADLVIKHGGAIAGRVTFDDGSPAAGVRVSLEFAERGDAMYQLIEGDLRDLVMKRIVGQQTDDAGRYRIAGLPAGKYRVTVSLETQHPSLETVGNRTPESFFEESMDKQNIFVYAPGAFKKVDATVVELHGDEVADGVDVAVRLDGLHTLHGRVLAFSDRHGLSHTHLLLHDDAGFSSDVTTEVDGSFHFDYIPEGTYKLLVWDIGKPEDDAAPVYENINKTVMVTSQDMVLDDFLMKERKKAGEGAP